MSSHYAEEDLSEQPTVFLAVRRLLIELETPQVQINKPNLHSLIICCGYYLVVNIRKMGLKTAAELTECVVPLYGDS